LHQDRRNGSNGRANDIIRGTGDEQTRSVGRPLIRNPLILPRKHRFSGGFLSTCYPEIAGLSSNRVEAASAKQQSRFS
jgi:hypothetical protein